MVRVVGGERGIDPSLRAGALPLKRSDVVTLDGRSPDCARLRLLMREYAQMGIEDAPRAPAVFGLTAPVHVLVSERTPRWQTDARRQHSAAEPLPRRSFVRVEPGLLLSSPEHIVVQAASRLDVVSLAWLMSELCARYSIHPRLGGAILPAQPLTSLSQMRLYLTQAAASGAYGARKALGCVKHAIEGAASPWELALALSMTMPRAKGGYAIPKPLLNHRIEADKRVRAMYGRSHFVADACWAKDKLVVEYDSDAFHLDANRRAHDNDRRAALEEMGYRVIPISTKQRDTLVLSDNAFQRIAKHLGVKNRTGESQYDWQSRRSDLRRQLRQLAMNGVGGKL